MMFIITNYQRNADQSYNEIPSHILRMTTVPKLKTKITSVGENVEQLKPRSTIGWNVKWLEAITHIKEVLI